MMNESQLIQTIKVHIAKGDRAAEKSEQHYVAAGQHLKTLKAQHGGTWAEWEELLKDKIGIGKSRASELMFIADGTKTVEKVRADTAERTAKTRALQSSPLRSGENTGEPEAAADTMKAVPTKPIPSQVRRELEAKDAHIDELESARAYDKDLAEELQAAKIKIAGLESEVEELKAEIARLRAELEAKPETATEKQGEIVPKRGRGRPPGSLNKPKPVPAEGEETDAHIKDFHALDDGLDLPESLRRTTGAAASTT
jgi:hypothetical protein